MKRNGTTGRVVTSVKGTKENGDCANRGLCDTVEGTCNCFDTNGDAYDSSDGYGHSGSRGDCGYKSLVKTLSMLSIYFL